MNFNNPAAMNNGDSIAEEIDCDYFAKFMQEDPTSSSPPIAPVTSTHPGSIEQDGFRENDPSLFDYGDHWPLFPIESFAANSGWPSVQDNMYTSSESVPGQSAPDWNLQEGYSHLETGQPYQPENNVAFGKSI